MNKSPLAMMKNRKVRRYSEGGGVEGDWSDAQIEALDLDSMTDEDMDYMFNDIASGGSAVPYTEGDWTEDQITSLGMDGMSDVELDALFEALGSSGVEDVFNNPQQVISHPNITPVEAGAGLVSIAPTQAVAAQQSGEDGFGKKVMSWLNAKNWDGSAQPEALPGGLTKADLEKMSPFERAMVSKMLAPKEEQSNWAKMLQLGLAGAGGLASFSDAKSKNKAMEQYYGKMDQQRADSMAEYAANKARAGRFNIDYSKLTPAKTSNRRAT